MNNEVKHVKHLIEKATKCDANDALKLTQAALNAAHAIATLANIGQH